MSFDYETIQGDPIARAYSYKVPHLYLFYAHPGFGTITDPRRSSRREFGH